MDQSSGSRQAERWDEIVVSGLGRSAEVAFDTNNPRIPLIAAAGIAAANRAIDVDGTDDSCAGGNANRGRGSDGDIGIGPRAVAAPNTDIATGPCKNRGNRRRRCLDG